MDARWQILIDSEMKKQYMHDLKNFITERRKEVTVLPAATQLFDAFRLCNFGILKVIIIGQDPYPTAKDAHGLAFSSKSKETPYSLKNIFDEIYQDFYSGETGNVHPFKSNDLTEWAEQGVLLLNSCLTCDEGNPGSHRGKGWELFIENTVKYINERHGCRLVFMLWGKEAKQYEQYIDKEKHLILTSEHPAAAKHNRSAWFGNKHFTKANNFINKHYLGMRAPINWGTWKGGEKRQYENYQRRW